MKKVILSIVLGIVVFSGLSMTGRFPKAWGDIGGLTVDTGHQAYWAQFYNCTVNNGIVTPGTCSSVGTNWSSLLGYMETNINWQDLPGVTGSPTSASTWLKTGAP